jgi:hypothetical protein
VKKSLLIEVSGIEHAAFEAMVSWVKRAARADITRAGAPAEIPAAA